MKKKYNIHSRSDMKKFEQDLKEEVENNISEQLTSMIKSSECPNCHKAQLIIKDRKAFCPNCKEFIDITIN